MYMYTTSIFIAKLVDCIVNQNHASLSPKILRDLRL